MVVIDIDIDTLKTPFPAELKTQHAQGALIALTID
jgi:hypothetical protein